MLAHPFSYLGLQSGELLEVCRTVDALTYYL